jgi:hypothetical protein
VAVVVYSAYVTCQVWDRTAADVKGKEGCCIDRAT